MRLPDEFAGPVFQLEFSEFLEHLTFKHFPDDHTIPQNRPAPTYYYVSLRQ